MLLCVLILTSASLASKGCARVQWPTMWQRTKHRLKPIALQSQLVSSEYVMHHAWQLQWLKHKQACKSPKYGATYNTPRVRVPRLRVFSPARQTFFTAAWNCWHCQWQVRLTMAQLYYHSLCLTLSVPTIMDIDTVYPCYKMPCQPTLPHGVAFVGPLHTPETQIIRALMACFDLLMKVAAYRNSHSSIRAIGLSAAASVVHGSRVTKKADSKESMAAVLNHDLDSSAAVLLGAVGTDSLK
ncbi:hypothetical protein HaLaN_04933, partial [Haematococcus lacustris]